ncbi:MAG: Ada metal-binding domain-containing protein [Opitutus sp.]
MLESDASCNGRFFSGVMTTGIYCLPSCKARKPKPGNVRFFPTCEAARLAGLRACRKCHPDDFARGADPVLDDIEHLVAEIRDNPGAFPDVRAVVRRSGFGATRLFELVRQHFQSTPAEILVRARIDLARRSLLENDAGLLTIAGAVGFESPSVFHEHFRRLNGLTPAAYRGLRSSHAFEIALPVDYPLGHLRRALGRDRHSVTDRLEGDVHTSAVRLKGGVAVLTLKLGNNAVRAEFALVKGSHSPVPAGRTAAPAAEAHGIVAGLLGLDQDAAAFARHARKLGLARLVAGRPGLRITQTPSIFDGVLWSIIGQQINFPFACVLKRRLIERTGEQLQPGLYAPPTPEAVANLQPEDLLPLQFSRQKADYLVSTARLIVEGTLPIEGLRTMSATRAERTLLAVHGLGPWSVNYLMMRALGFPDCVPLGDTGVTSALQALLRLEERPDVPGTRRLMSIFSPFRSLATAHLWQFQQPAPP